MGLISPKLRASANGQECTFQIPGVCCHDSSRVVLCHIRDESKGLSNKANDWSAAFGCDQCHEAIDQHRLPREWELFYCLRALQRTMQVWIDRGLVLVAGVDFTKPKTRPRKPSNIKNRPLAGTKKSGLRKKMNGTVEARGQLWEQPSLGKEDSYGD